VPSQQTTYACVGFAFPANETLTIIRFDAILDNSQVLHHMVMFQLPVGAADFGSTPQPCNMAPGGVPIYAWAPGGDPVIMPPEAGFTVGGTTGLIYVVLQLHYNNPTSQSGYIDSSGVKMYLSAQARQYQAGFMFLGMDTSLISIPAHQPSFHMSGRCTTPTTAYALPQNGIQVFAAMGHMHYLGRQIWTDLLRNKTKVASIVDNPHYDFNAQKFLPLNLTIFPGDEMVTHCVWDSTKANTTTFGGESTSNEMCLSAILYYPSIGADGCTGSETQGCNCSYGDPCENSYQCTRFLSNCDAHKNCSSCAADSNCGWCDSNYFGVCFDNWFQTACTSQVAGAWNSCAQTNGTLCTSLYTNCTQCNADTARGCSWCHFDYGYDSKCLSSPAAAPTVAGIICYDLDGTYRPTQCLGD